MGNYELTSSWRAKRATKKEQSGSCSIEDWKNSSRATTELLDAKRQGMGFCCDSPKPPQLAWKNVVICFLLQKCDLKIHSLYMWRGGSFEFILLFLRSQLQKGSWLAAVAFFFLTCTIYLDLNIGPKDSGTRGGVLYSSKR